MLLHQISEFLEEGAFLRYGDDVYVFFGAFHEAQDGREETLLYTPNFFLDQSPPASFGSQEFTKLATKDFQSLMRQFLEGQSIDMNFSWQEPRLEDYLVSFANIEKAMDTEKLVNFAGLIPLRTLQYQENARRVSFAK